MKEITMPKLSDTMTEGAVVSWRKEKGATVARGDVIAEVETDKATMELEAFASGILLEIRVEAGETVPVGTVIGLIGDEGEEPPARKDETEQAEKEQPKEKEKPENEKRSEKEEPEQEAKPELHEPVGEKENPAAEEAAAPGEVRAAPVVRRRARELGIDLEAVTGSGPGGRVLLEDLEAAESGATPGEEAAAQKQQEHGMETSRGGEAVEAKPLSRMRAAIARTVSDSWRSIPHFSVTVDVCMDAAERLRESLKKDGRKVSITALLVKASAKALAKFPRLNASLKEERLVIHQHVNIGLVTRRDDGLLVPVLRDCTELSLADIALRTTQLVDRARQGQLSDTEMSGGTFAISNMGMYGIHSFVALILPPMTAVLAVGSVRDAVVAEGGEPVVSRMMLLTLSADHRIVDGVYVAEFLQQLKSFLEEPDGLKE